MVFGHLGWYVNFFFVMDLRTSLSRLCKILHTNNATLIMTWIMSNSCDTSFKKISGISLGKIGVSDVTYLEPNDATGFQRTKVSLIRCQAVRKVLKSISTLTVLRKSGLLFVKVSCTNKLGVTETLFQFL